MELLRKEFSELKTVMADQLMYVKEDLILPHHYTFYDFIVTKVSFSRVTPIVQGHGSMRAAKTVVGFSV